MLHDTMDKALAVETASRELFDKIRQGFTKDQWRIQQADRVTEQKLQAIGNAQNKEAFTKGQFAGWQSHYEFQFTNRIKRSSRRSMRPSRQSMSTIRCARRLRCVAKWRLLKTILE